MGKRALVRGYGATAVLLLVLLVAACGGAPDGQALVESRCITCHNLVPVRTAVKTEEEWQETVERMVALGARLSEAQQSAVVSYLLSQ
jgi:quinohemoprotein amine dehydrogenase